VGKCKDGGGLGLGGGVTPLQGVELPQLEERVGSVVETEKKNWKSAEQGRGWFGVKMKLSSRQGLQTSSVAVTSSIRSDMAALNCGSWHRGDTLPLLVPTSYDSSFNLTSLKCNKEL
jgi:hypothetical protein